jgi:hypothetical protein
VERYAKTADASMSKANRRACAHRPGGAGEPEARVFKKLKENLAQDNPQEQERLVDEFRDLILGR